MAGDIHALEIEFAKNPSLEACIPLCEAYLSAKRFMEAMVVCKKGIKNAPKDPRGRVLLARVYLDQGKLPKAEQEITGALEAFPGNATAFEMMGQIMLQQGRNQEAVQALQQALGADPNLQNARAMLQQLGVQAPAPQQAAPQPQQAPPQQPPQMPQQGQPMPGQQVPPQMPGQQVPPQMPGQVPPQMPGQQMPGQQMPAQPGQPGETGETPKLEHVSDFFSDETLGFGGDAEHIETAGPGRLTILGFVPKTTGSIKTTILVALVLLALCAVFVFWQYVSSENQRLIDKHYGELKKAMEEDKYSRYQAALKTAQEILKVDDAHNQTLSSMAYAEAILGTEHGVDGAIARAKSYLARAIDTGEQDTEFRVAAAALLACAGGQHDQGIAEIKKVLDKGGSAPLIELEAFRCMQASKPNDKETARQLARLTQSVVYQSRAFKILGWHFFRDENWPKADQYFDEALKNSKDNPNALLGQAITDLLRDVGIKERQKEIEERIKKVHALPKDELSDPTNALAHFSRALLYQWQGKRSEADADFKKAEKLDPGNSMFHYVRGRGLVNLGRHEEAIASLSKASTAEPNNPKIFKLLGKAQMQVGDFKGSKQSFDRVRQLSGRDYEIELLDADRLRTSKQLDKAIAAYKAIPLEAGAQIYVKAQLGMSRAFRDGRKGSKAVELIRNVLENTPKGTTPPLLAELWCEFGQAYDSARQKDEAIKCYMYGVEQYPLYADCHYYMCMAMDRRDPETKQACMRYQQVSPRGQYAAEVAKRIKRLR